MAVQVPKGQIPVQNMPHHPAPTTRKRRPLGIMIFGTLTALGGLALLLVAD